MDSRLVTYLETKFSRTIFFSDFSARSTTFESVEAHFTNGQSVEFPENGILTVDPPVSTKDIKLVINSGNIYGLGKITLKTIGEHFNPCCE